jgi:hypothetical protein
VRINFKERCMMGYLSGEVLVVLCVKATWRSVLFARL